MSLENRVAIITGGSTGIGLGIANALATKGVKLVLGQLPSLIDEARRVAKAMKDTDAIALEVDVRHPDAVERMVEDAMGRFGRIDILVNNAALTGMPAISPMMDSPPSKVDEIVDANLKGTFYCSQAVAKRMIAAGRGGNIVHISSVGAFAAQEFASLYCATKAGLVSLAQSMALELAPHRIRVNCVAPGDIYTEPSARVTEEKEALGASGRYTRSTPLGRRGQPEDIGHAVAYLVSDEAGFITGTTLCVDGGFLAY